eukprot:15472437-Alexandrium_andersonii.AAC.1
MNASWLGIECGCPVWTVADLVYVEVDKRGITFDHRDPPGDPPQLDLNRPSRQRCSTKLHLGRPNEPETS